MSKKNKGFTLIEMLVVIAIIAVISGVIVVNFRESSDIHKLQRSAQIVVQGIREAQNMSLSSTEIDGEVYNYYGVHFNKQNPTSFYIYASENMVYNSGEEVKTIELETEVVIDSLSGGNKLGMAFIPPYSFIEFNPSASEGWIVIKLEGADCPSNECRCITANDKGWISISCEE